MQIKYTYEMHLCQQKQMIYINAFSSQMHFSLYGQL